MLCQICNKNQASVHITEIARGQRGEGSQGGPQPTVEQKHICEPCSQSLKIPHLPVSSKGVVNIWKLLQQSAQKAREESGLACPHCGMTLAEFRSKGRLGCPHDYEIFRAHLDPLLQKVHNASQHVGRGSSASPADVQRRERLTHLRTQLETAIKEEAYEHAARLRDEIQSIEGRPSAGSDESAPS
jgi:protein arginine kinase activator